MPRPNNNNHQDQQQQDELNSTRKQKKKQSPPRFIKNTIQDVDPQEIVVNLSKTHYDIIETVVEQLGWAVERSKKSQKWDIMWTDWHIEAQDLFRLNDQQKISHFPAIYVLAKKNFLGRGLMKMNKQFPNEYNYFPFTWSIPSEIGEFMRYDNQLTQQQRTIYIFKPQSSSQGKGIILFTKLQEIQGRTGIVQLYVNNPLLIDRLKFDMRIYVLIYGCDPLRIYIYEEGLARFATEDYQKAKKKNLKDNFIHLTNYAINKTNKKFIFNTNDKNMNVGHKRSLTSIFTLLRNKGYNIDEIKKKIDRMIVKTLLVGKPMLEHMYGLSQTDNLANDHCFQILGFDVLINDQLEPILLEVNHTPSFVTDTPLDKTIKKNLIKETLLLLNVNVKTKKAKLERRIEFQQKRAQRKLTKLTPEEKMQQKRLIEKEKDQYEASTLKKFRRLYPTQTNEFLQMQEYAQKLFNEQSGFKNKQIYSLKNTTSLRSGSLQIMPKAKKGKRNNGQSAYIKSIKPLQEMLMQKLPDISPRKASFKATMTPKVLLKNYEFTPDKAFANITQRYAKRLNMNQKIINVNANLDDKEMLRHMKREGSFVQPKIMNLNELAILSSPSFDEIDDKAEQPKIEKNTRKSFLDFVSLSNRDKNRILKEKAPMTFSKSKNPHPKKLSSKVKNESFECSIQDQVFTMKKLSINKSKILNQ